MKKLLLSIIFLFFISVCSHKEEQYHPKAIVLSAIGDVKSNGRDLSITEEISDTDSITVGNNSLCDLQLLDSNSLAVIRIKSNSKFRLSGKKIGSTRENNFNLHFGNAILNVSKTSRKEEIKTMTPTAIAGVRGTKYEVAVSPNGTSKIIVLEGKVATRVRVPEMEKFSYEEIKNSKVLNALENSLDDTEIKITKGESSEIPVGINTTILKETNLQDLLKKNKPEEIDQKTDLKKIEESLSGMENSDLKLSTQEVDEKTMGEKIKEYDEITPFEKDKINNKSTRNQLIKTRFKTIEESWLKKLQRWLKGL